MTEDGRQRRVLLLISAALVLATIIAYEPIRKNRFVIYDDNTYVTENPHVTGGITRQSIVWAFTKSHAANWHPLTWLSHMLDCELYGLNPLGHHITNLLIHIANTLLLFLLLSKMTSPTGAVRAGAVWRSSFVAAAFALHPLHVESVAWVSERKDVLSGFFWIVTIFAYVYYARRPSIARYSLVLLAFVPGLLSKPMVVTLPFVLLLLDYWPLGRLTLGKNVIEQQQGASEVYQKATIWHLFAEKIPLFALSAVSCVITFVVQRRSGAVIDLGILPIYARVVNALGCYLDYVVKMVYPKDLAAMYPLPEKMPIDAASLAVMGAAVLLVLYGRGRRWLAVGILWYLGTLVPVIGLVQVGGQIMADRYTYLPMIGLFIAVAWGAAEIIAKLSRPKPVAAGIGVAAVIAMVLLARIQSGYWRDTETLYTHTLAVTKNNYIMLNGYGLYLCRQGKYEEGMQYLEQAKSIKPNYIPVWDNICTTLLAQKKFDEAIDCYNEFTQKAKNWPEINRMYQNLGWAYEQKGNLELAEINYRKALEFDPEYEPALQGLASVLRKQGKPYKPQETGNFKF